jgi:disulfide bond formation protein DsbB
MVKINNLSDKNIYLGISIVSISTIIIAFLLEKFGGFVPCFLCWTQRFVFAFIFIASTALFLKTPKKRLSIKLGGATVSAISLIGIGFAFRHIYVIFKPPESACGFGPDMAFQMLPFMDALQSFLIGGSSCSNTDGVLGVPFPFWALGIYSLILFASIFIVFRNKK